MLASPIAALEFETNRIPDTVVPDGMMYASFFERFYYSPFGQYLAQQEPRYNADFGYEPSAMYRDLGPDAHPLAHNSFVFLYTRNAIRLQEIITGAKVPERVTGIALLAAGVHDMGESKHPLIKKVVGGVVGDIPYNRKNPQQRAVETAIRRFLYGELYSDVAPDVLDEMEGVISHGAAGTPAHDFFEIGHATTHLKAGMRAGRVVLAELGIENSEPPYLRTNRPTDHVKRLTDLSLTVVPRMEQLLGEYAAKGYAAANLILVSSAEKRKQIASNLRLHSHRPVEGS